MMTKNTPKKAFVFNKSLAIKMTLFVFIFNSFTTFSQLNSCNATLKVEKDRNVRSTPLNGTYYPMILTNNATTSKIFSLNFSNLNSNCQNPDNSNISNNVSLTANFLDEQLNPLSQLVIYAGQTANFFIHINVPNGTPFGKWSCIKINAIANECSNYEISTVLHTFVIDPNED